MALALRFISGKYQGGEFPLEENRDVVVGRSSELDMVLVEEMVSRKHARLVLIGGRVEIEDLGSTNGTFVNGERITRASVGEGDRILIGSNILRVVEQTRETSAARSRAESAPRRGVRRLGATSSGEARMSGNLEEIPLPDLLQLFGTSKKDGVLLIDSGISVGRIVLQKGRIQHAQLDREDGTAEPIPALKAVYRMTGWESGVFELDPPGDETYAEALDCSVQEVLMEAFRQKDELSLLQVRLPPWNAVLKLQQPLSAKLRDLAPVQLDVLQMVLNRGTLGAVMDTSPLSDLETAEAMLALIEREYLSVEEVR